MCCALTVAGAQTKSDYEKLLERVTALEAELEQSNLQEEKQEEVKKPRLTLGGYGEVVATRNFYSDAFQRYSVPSMYAESDGYGRVDIPHAVFFVGYDFGKGWSFGSEIEFEHGGLEVATEIEAEETGEYENEVESGGEVALEQFWINKKWSDALNLKMGHIIVPVGQTNKYHMPNEYFGVYRPEGESTILPCAWHESGFSLWGTIKDWSYEVMLIAGLDSDRFSSGDWVASGSGSPYEFKIATNYAGAFRIDNNSIKNLTISLSGYYGHSASNSLKSMYGSDVKGAIAIGAIDAVYRSNRIVARANFDYGTLSDAYEITYGNNNVLNSSPSPRQDVASAAIAYGGEAGYNVLYGLSKGQKLFVFGRYEYYDSMYKTDLGTNDKTYYSRTCLSAGINYSPISEVTLKAEYQSRRLPSIYNNENTILIGVTYTGLFKH